MFSVAEFSTHANCGVAVSIEAILCRCVNSRWCVKVFTLNEKLESSTIKLPASINSIGVSVWTMVCK